MTVQLFVMSHKDEHVIVAEVRRHLQNFVGFSDFNLPTVWVFFEVTSAKFLTALAAAVGWYKFCYDIPSQLNVFLACQLYMGQL